jgi:hypothetical protein
MMVRYSMYILSFILGLVLVVPQAVTAENASADAPRDLVVSDFYWGRVTSRTFVDQPYNTSSDPWNMPRIRRRLGGPPPAVIIQRETYALVRNVGSRTVKFVTWDYVFYSDAKREHETQRHRFRSKERIAPGEMKFITESVSEPAPTTHGAVVISRLEFEDGTSWERASAQ